MDALRTTTNQKPMPEPKSKATEKSKTKPKPKRHYHTLESYVPQWQLGFVLGEALRRHTGDAIDITEFNDAVRRILVNIREKNQTSPLANGLLRPVLRIELVSPPSPQNQPLEALLPQLDLPENRRIPQGPRSKFLDYDMTHYIAVMCGMLRKLDTTGVARTRSNQGVLERLSHRFLNNNRNWTVDQTLFRGDDWFGCTVEVDFRYLKPPPPNRLFHAELVSVLSFLRRRLDNPVAKTKRPQSPHDLAPPAVVVTVMSDANAGGDPPPIWLRVLRASFKDTTPMRPGTCSSDEVVLSVEVSETFDMSDIHNRDNWSEEDFLNWNDKVKVVMRVIMDARLGSAEEKEAAEQEIAERQRLEELGQELARLRKMEDKEEERERQREMEEDEAQRKREREAASDDSEMAVLDSSSEAPASSVSDLSTAGSPPKK